MTTKTQFDDLFKAIDTETTRIALKFEDLLAKLAAGGMTADEEAAQLAEGARLVEKLKAVAADPADPVPVPEPEPTPAPEGEPASTPQGEVG